MFQLNKTSSSHIISEWKFKHWSLLFNLLTCARLKTGLKAIWYN